MLGLFDTRHQVVRLRVPEHPGCPWKLWAEGRSALSPPVMFRYETRETNSIQQLTGKWKLLLFPQNCMHLAMFPVAEGTRAHGEGRDSGAIRDVRVGSAANYKS